jgi:hypothetical protein
MRLIMLPLGASAAALLSAAGLFLAVEHREAPKAPDYRVTQVGGLEYESMLGRPLDPSNRIDKQILAGLPRRDRRVPRGQALYGAFISVTNDSTRALPAAKRIELRDESGHVYRAIPLPARNPYAYAPRLVHARTRIPAQHTPAAENLAATGRLVLFRVPAWRYRNGRFELVIHNPRHEAATQSLIVS